MHGASVLMHLEKVRPPNTAAAGKGPMAALHAAESGGSASERKAWLAESRTDAILGACSRSHKSVRTGVRCWMAFVGMSCWCVCGGAWGGVACVSTNKYDPELMRYFPPPLHLLLSWTTIFRSGHTLRNYLGYLQTACLLAEVSTQVFQEPALKKAKASVDAAGNFSRRERMFIRRSRE